MDSIKDMSIDTVMELLGVFYTDDGKIAPGPGPRRRGKAKKSLELIAAAEEILAEIQPCSVRAVCYQLFNRKLIPDMSKNSTSKAGQQLVWAREQGLIPWTWIVDETRGAEGSVGWEDPEAFAEAVQASWKRDRWIDQGVRVEVWSEKGTVRGTLLPVLSTYGVQFRVMHGFGSATEVHDVAATARGMSAPLVVLYVGDHDPSGVFMSEVDLPTRLKQYGAEMGTDIHLRRLALTADDGRRGNLASFPVATKKEDPRYRWWVANDLGPDCWELDAMSPVVLRQRVEQAIEELITDRAAWDRAETVREVERASLVDMMGKWTATLAGAA